MKRSEIIFGIIKIPFDGLSVFLAVILSYYLRQNQIDLIPSVQLLEPATTLPAPDYFLQNFALPAAALFIFFAALGKLYNLQSTSSAWKEIGDCVGITGIWLISIVGWYFFVEKQLFYSRILLIHSALFTALFIGLERSALIWLQRFFLRTGRGIRYVISIGHSAPTPDLVNYLSNDSRYKYLGHQKNLSGLIKTRNTQTVDLAIQTDPARRSLHTIGLLEYCRNEHIGYGFMPPVLAEVPHLLKVEKIGLTPVLRFKPTPLDGWGMVIKRLFDFSVSLFLLAVLSPLFFVVSLLILIFDGWPVFYISKRIGQFGTRDIPVIKFRSMVKNADQIKTKLLNRNERKDGPLFKMKNDPRITKTGHFLRRFDIDELPQLFNVAAGQMSLVGPRPHLPEEVAKYKPYQRRVFAVCPGITGLAQISGRSNLKFEEEVKTDLRYIEEWSIVMDLWILWRTVFVLLKGE